MREDSKSNTGDEEEVKSPEEMSPGERVAELVTQTAKPSDLMLKEQEIRKWKRMYDRASKEALDYRQELEVLDQFTRPIITEIKPSSKRTEHTQAAAILVASDWHVEETVDPRTISGLNEYNPEIAKKRSENFFCIGQRLIDVLARDLSINTIVLALLGDFITNSLHEDAIEGNAMPPIEAALYAQDLISSGIHFLLKNSPKRKLIIPCHSGNHARTTKKIHHAHEKGHSLEYMMYVSLAREFEKNSNVEFRLADGYHSWIDILGVKTRFHHGHNIRYAGGVGGITIPVNKAIAQWDKAEQAKLDIFAHFHQYTDLGKWFCNGSLIGYNAFAVSIKAEYEEPQQGFLIIDEKRGRTHRAPIFVDE